MILRVTDGTTTIDLSGGTDDITLAENYAPVAPDLSVVEAVAETTRDGGDVTAIARRNVTESVVISITGAAFSVIQTAKDALELLFVQAIHRQNTGKGDRVFVEYRAASSGTVYRSELLHARMEPDPETASEGWIADAAMRFVIAWRRRFYWEGTETELALDNGSTVSKATGGVTIYNHDDAGSGHDNWVDIDGDDVDGVLPTPLEIQLYNSYNDSTRTASVWIGHNVFATPSSFQHILEGEDADYIAGGAAATAGATHSGGYTQAATWSGDSETLLFEWTLDSTFLSYAKGNRFRLLARITTSPADAWLHARIRIASLTTLKQLPETLSTLTINSQMHDFGVLQIPPWLLNEDDLYSIQLSLYGRKTGGSTVALDFLQLTPLDSYRTLVPRGYNAAYGTTIVDDGITPALYVDWASSGKVGHYVGHGDPVHARPGFDQRLYVLATNEYGNIDVARTHSVRVWYRPRLLTI